MQPNHKNDENWRDDVDISLIKINLRLSYEERIQKHEDARQFAQELKNAGRCLKQDDET